MSRAYQSAILLMLTGLFVSRPCRGEWAAYWQPVPLDRLLTNVGRHVQQSPSDARGHYILGRLYSLAFARGTGDVDVNVRNRRTETRLQLPEFPPYASILVKPTVAVVRRRPEALQDLAAAIRHYQRATQLAPQEPLYWLGLGWMLQQGVAYASQVDAPFLGNQGIASASVWRQQALMGYRRAYHLSLPKELKHPRRVLLGEADTSISREAGEGILQLLRRQPRTPAREAEATSIRQALATLPVEVIGITPIIFPISRPTPLVALLQSDHAVSFDLAGDDSGERWPWVGPKTGILVWDPEKTGRITSGRQLFGSVTWWMFWKDGYQALAALDDDQNGWLEGAELQGLAVWCDRNGNGISEPGEVQPLAQLGVTRVAVRPAGRNSGALWNPAGLVLHGGSVLPTYDWVPESIRSWRVPAGHPGPRIR